MGLTQETCHTCYMLDFGLARQYTKANGEVRPVSICKKPHQKHFGIVHIMLLLLVVVILLAKTDTLKETGNDPDVFPREERVGIFTNHVDEKNTQKLTEGFEKI